jgi:hypothetical protein
MFHPNLHQQDIANPGAIGQSGNYPDGKTSLQQVTQNRETEGLGRLQTQAERYTKSL